MKFDNILRFEHCVQSVEHFFETKKANAFAQSLINY